MIALYVLIEYLLSVDTALNLVINLRDAVTKIHRVREGEREGGEGEKRRESMLYRDGKREMERR